MFSALLPVKIEISGTLHIMRRMTHMRGVCTLACAIAFRGEHVARREAWGTKSGFVN